MKLSSLKAERISGLDPKPIQLDNKIKSKSQDHNLSDNESNSHGSHTSEESDNDKEASDRTPSFITRSIKQEPTESEMQTFAHHTMNELLGLYGYEQVGENDIKKIHPTTADVAISLQKQQENLSNLSPSGIRKCARQSLLDYDTDEEVKCAWCSKPSHAAFTLKEEEIVKSFCSEKCFAACRRAKFKKSRGGSSKTLSETPIFREKLASLASSDSDKEQIEARNFSSSLGGSENTKETASITRKQSQERFSVGTCDKPNKYRPSWLLKNTEKGDDCRGSFVDKGLLHKGSKNLMIGGINKMKRKDSPQRHKTDHNSYKKPAGVSTYKLDASIKYHKPKDKPERKFSADACNSFRNVIPSPKDQNLNLLSQSPLLNFQLPPSQAFMGFPGLTNPIGSPTTLDIDSFRLGMLAARNQHGVEKPLVQFPANGLNFEIPFFPNIGNFSTAPNKTRNLSNNNTSRTGSSTPSSLPSPGQQTQKMESLKPRAEVELNGLKNESEKNLSQTKFPAPMLLMPFPIPIPIPFLLPIPSHLPENSKGDLIEKKQNKNGCNSPTSSAIKEGDAEQLSSVDLKFSNKLKSDEHNLPFKISREETKHSPITKEVPEKLRTSLDTCTAVDLSVKRYDKLKKSSDSNNKRRLDDQQQSKIDNKFLKLTSQEIDRNE